MNAYELAKAVYAHPLARTVMVLILVNVLIGIAVSLATRSFYLGSVADWLATRAVPYIIGAGSMQLVLMTIPEEYTGLASTSAQAVWLFVIAAMLGKVLDGLTRLGIPLPSVLGSKPLPESQAKP